MVSPNFSTRHVRNSEVSQTSHLRESLTLRLPHVSYVNWAAFWIVAQFLPAMRKKLCCSCRVQPKVQAHHPMNWTHRCHCQLMMNILRFRIKINSKSTRELLKDDDDWKRTTERILRVPWEPWVLDITSHFRSFSPLVSHLSHHFSCYGIVVAGNLSVTSWVVMPARLALCDLGAPGWGEPWFVLFCFPHTWVWRCLWCLCFRFFLCLPAIPILAMIQWYHRLPPLLMLHNWSAGHFSPSRFVFALCVLACFACVFFFVWLCF